MKRRVFGQINHPILIKEASSIIRNVIFGD